MPPVKVAGASGFRLLAQKRTYGQQEIAYGKPLGPLFYLVDSGRGIFVPLQDDIFPRDILVEFLNNAKMSVWELRK